MSINYDITKDLRFLEGIEKGIEKGTENTLRNSIIGLLRNTKLTVQEISISLNCSVDYVLSIQKSLSAK